MLRKQVNSGLIIILLNILFILIVSPFAMSAYWTSPDIKVACQQQAYPGVSGTMANIDYNKFSCPAQSACKDYGVYYLSGTTIKIWCDDNVYFLCNSAPNCGQPLYDKNLGYSGALYSACASYGTGLSAECVSPKILSLGRYVECNYKPINTDCTNGHCDSAGKCIPLKAAFTWSSTYHSGGNLYLDASTSTDPDNKITSYTWESTNLNPNPASFSSPTWNTITSGLPTNNNNCQNIVVKLTITDSLGNTNSVTKSDVCVWKYCPSCICRTCSEMGYNCGSWTNDCGTTYDCGTCSGTCVNNICLQNCATSCTSLGQGYASGVCTSTNYGENYFVCSGSACRWAYHKITGTSCSSNCWCYKSSTCGTSTTCPSLCTAGGCCTPNCAGKACGDDGCGGSCGTCTLPSTCVNNQCTCVPSCAGKTCGDDGCGGSCGSCAGTETCVNNQCKTQCPVLCANQGYSAGTCTATNYQEGAYSCYGTASCYYNFHDETTNSDCASGQYCWCYNKSADCPDIANCPSYCTASGCSYCKPNGLSCNANSDCCSNRCSNGFCCSSGTCCGANINCPVTQYCTSSFNCANCPANGCSALSVNDGTNCLANEYGRYNIANHCSLTCETEIQSLEACQICNGKYYLSPSFQAKVLSDIQAKINAGGLSSSVITKKGCCVHNNDCVYDGLCIIVGSKLDVDLDLRQEVCG